MRTLPVIAIVGRPNVGKSTFFNRVLGERRAIVEDEPGVTRDRLYARAEWAGRQFYVVDTGGLVEDSDRPIDRQVRQQVLAALDEADVVAFVVDARAGPHPLDYRIAELLRARRRPVVLVANKVDRLGDVRATEHHEFWSLGLGEPLPVSSLSGKGSGDVLDALVAHLPPTSEQADTADAVRVAVIGRPNVGKSSFVNRLLGEERMIVAEEPGTTRDAVDTPLRYHGRTLIFVDTAGLRRHAKRKEAVELYSALRTERVIEEADVAILLLDALEPLTGQDLRIAERAWEAGTGLIVVVNKWDLVAPKDDKTAPHVERALRERAPFLHWVPILFASALTGQRVHRVLDLVLTVADERRRRIPTHEVNDVLHAALARVRPPTAAGRPIKFYYGTQAEVAPPTFVLWTNLPEKVPEHYLRYLQNAFRQAWTFRGVPLRLRLRGRRERDDE